MPTLHLICGLPGAGKTTLARRIETETATVRLTPDEWLLELGAHVYDEGALARSRRFSGASRNACSRWA